MKLIMSAMGTRKPCAKPMHILLRMIMEFK